MDLLQDCVDCQLPAVSMLQLHAQGALQCEMHVHTLRNDIPYVSMLWACWNEC